MSKQDAQKARSSSHSSETRRVRVNTGVTFTATGEQHEYIAEPEGQLEERANANDHRRRSGVRVSGARDEQSLHSSSCSAVNQ